MDKRSVLRPRSKLLRMSRPAQGHSPSRSEVNNGKSVDSLFLDEGFGNLDTETLYTVISTLESLHTHGKTIGVISHVEAVQKRIKAQLQVVKNRIARAC